MPGGNTPVTEKTSPQAASQSGKSVPRKPIREKPPSTGK